MSKENFLKFKNSKKKFNFFELLLLISKKQGEDEFYPTEFKKTKSFSKKD